MRREQTLLLIFFRTLKCAQLPTAKYLNENKVYSYFVTIFNDLAISQKHVTIQLSRVLGICILFWNNIQNMVWSTFKTKLINNKNHASYPKGYSATWIFIIIYIYIRTKIPMDENLGLSII